MFHDGMLVAFPLSKGKISKAAVNENVGPGEDNQGKSAKNTDSRRREDENTSGDGDQTTEGEEEDDSDEDWTVARKRKRRA